MPTRLRALRVACLLLASLTLSAQVKQVVFVLPGPNANGTSVYALATNPLSPITSFTSGAGSNLLFAKPDGSNYYIVATSLSQTVTSVDNTFQTPQDIVNLTQTVTSGVMTPDGTRLALAAGSLHVINTTTNTDILSSGVSVGAGVSVFSVAVSLDGKTFYSLGTTSSGSQLNAIDSNSLTVKGTLAIPGVAANVAVGRNGLVYVSTQNQLEEIDPNSLQVTPGGTISMNATPGAIAFTTDGQYALVANQTPLTGSAALLISLANHAIISTVPNFGIILASLQVIGVNQILGYSSQNQTVYTFTIGNGGSIAQSLSPSRMRCLRGPSARSRPYMP